MPLNLNNAEAQVEFGELIPDNTIAPVQMNIRPGNAGEDGWATQAKTSSALYLSAEFTVTEGPFAKRKFWTNFTIDGDTEGHERAVKITMSRLRAIVESARGINPGDESEAARRAREIDVSDFDGIRFLAKIGIEKGKDGNADRNALKAAITPDSKDYRRIEQMKARTAGPNAVRSAGGGMAARPTNW